MWVYCPPGIYLSAAPHLSQNNTAKLVKQLSKSSEDEGRASPPSAWAFLPHCRWTPLMSLPVLGLRLSSLLFLSPLAFLFLLHIYFL